MKHVAKARVRSSNHLGSANLIHVMWMSALLLFLSISLATGGHSAVDTTAPSESTGTIDGAVESVERTVESVTLSIDMANGAEIDLRAAPEDVVIDTWDGDKVLVIVRKTPARPGEGMAPVVADAVNIRVKRLGRNVRIEALGSRARVRDLDISFHVLVPESQRLSVRTRTTAGAFDVAKIAHVVMRALHREALKWIVR